MPEDISEVIDASTNTVRDLDVQPYFTTSTWKASGFAGSVAFRVEVATFAGPEGVDRLITTTNYNGSHVRDLGYDFDRGVRTFEVTLSNPVAAGDEMLLAAFSFGDGNTKEGRVHNTMTMTQTGRLAGDTSLYNDQKVSSLDATVSDFGKQVRGTFSGCSASLLRFELPAPAAFPCSRRGFASAIYPHLWITLCTTSTTQ